MPISTEDFRNALSRFASGVTVVTTVDSNGKAFGITVSAFCSVSLEPPLILVCIEKTAGSHFAFLESGRFCVNILAEDQEELSRHFANPQFDKFETIKISDNQNGLILLDDCCANLVCTVKANVSAGDHTVFIASVESARVFEKKPLVYFRGSYGKWST
jgi:flavin reductase (DIM6/NTAB) family NADH-FMN oxidoreductase RutF